MILSYDIETDGLNTQKFILGTTLQENNKEAKTWFCKKDMWNYIIELGKHEAKRGKTLNCYAHNAQYDYYGIADFKDTNLKYYSERPFIVAYIHEGKEIIKFLDTLSIFQMPLKKLGDLIGLKKYDMPTDGNTGLLAQYCARDSAIVMESIKFLKKKLKENKIPIKRLYTINQIAINALMYRLRNEPKAKKIFEFDNLILTKYPDKIHQAYRGGRVECFKTGTFNNVTYIDINSLYPHCAIEMDFPDLSTEKLIKHPLTNFTKEEILSLNGISKALVYNDKNKLGVLPVRTMNGNHYPKQNTLIAGVWTHEELRLAKKEGYHILAIEWTMRWNTIENPLKDIMQEFYKKRKESKNNFDNWFWKQLMNRGLGKLAQRKTLQDYTIDSVEKAEEYIARNYKIIKGIGEKYMYKSEKTEQPKKPYYAPIITAKITALSRNRMYKELSKIKQEDLIYTDTDSIIYKNTYNFNYGEDIGQFKLEAENAEMTIYGRKTYCINNKNVVSGVRRIGITQEDFKKGEILNKRMVTLKTGTIEEAGTFKEEKRNLKRQEVLFNQQQKLMNECKVFIDIGITDLNYFMPKIERFI